MKTYIHTLTRRLRCAAGALLLAVGAVGCDNFSEELDPCPEGVRLRMVYDWNMEFANSFHNRVDCLTLHIFDATGRLIQTRIVDDRALLGDESWRMDLDLPAGSYRLVAYGGMACDRASFDYTGGVPATGDHHTSLGVALQPRCTSGDDPTDALLHPLFYGATDVTVEPQKMEEHTLPMIKDTNNLRLMLQQLNGDPVDGRDFDFEITDDNSVLGHDNMPVAGNQVTYLPWACGQAVAGVTPDGYEARVGFGELSTSRLVTSCAPRLRITHRESGRTVVDIPLINYLLLVKSEIHAQMPDQEFLDRQSEWSILFFLNDDLSWNKVTIKINDWTVRLNDAEL